MNEEEEAEMAKNYNLVCFSVAVAEMFHIQGVLDEIETFSQTGAADHIYGQRTLNHL